MKHLQSPQQVYLEWNPNGYNGAYLLGIVYDCRFREKIIILLSGITVICISLFRVKRLINSNDIETNEDINLLKIKHSEVIPKSKPLFTVKMLAAISGHLKLFFLPWTFL